MNETHLENSTNGDYNITFSAADAFDDVAVKKEINNVLFMTMHGNTTIDELETVALEVFDAVQASHIKHEKSVTVGG